jgi:GNAT superfamily N-acetyltransferase
MPGFVLEPDPEAFAARVSGFLLADPVLHTLPLSVLESIRAGRYPEWVLTRVESGAGEVLAVGVRTPPYNQIVAATDREALRTLAEGIAARGTPLPGTIGLVPWVQDFAGHWAAITTGCRVEEDKAERLFRLDELMPPQPAPGKPRPATAADADLLTEWTVAFCAEVGIDEPLSGRDSTLHSIDEGRRYLWEVEGTPVCDVGHGPAVGGQVRIGPVYTPREHRGRGYASNLTAHVTAELLAAGLVPTLFTDLANPTSNGIYRAIGYQPVADASMLRFVGRS